MLNSTRRDLLTVSGGALAGLFLTPVPWKLLDDVAIWTQNWSWVPRPPRGELNTRYTACTLCPAGCGFAARCVEAQPIGLAGVPQHPASAGALCTIGIGAHQLPYHPARLSPAPAAVDAATKEVAKARSQGVRVAFLDLRPGRAASAVYRKFALGFEGGLYLAPAPPESATLRAVAKLAGLPASVIERAKVVLAQIEAEDRVSPAHKLINDLPLFAAARPAAAPAPQESALTALVEALAALNPDEMSPRDALEALYALKAQLAKGKR